MSILRLVIPSPLRIEFDYLAPLNSPSTQLAELVPGMRVRVPFGRREVIGYLLGVKSNSDVPENKLKAALEILDEVPLLDPTMLELCHWAASYYHHPLGEVLGAAFPVSLRKGKPHKTLGETAWRLSTRGKGLPEGALKRSPRQAKALAILQQHHVVGTARLAEADISSGIMRELAKKELVEACKIPKTPRPGTSHAGLELNDEQSEAVASIKKNLGDFACHLLEGVTGSGKTEVYLQLIAECLAQEKQVLVLIPEIGLTPQTLGRFEARFDANVLALHSGLAEGARYQAWEAGRTGNAHIVIGTRSSVFAPMKNLGLIVVDEEHDTSYKQQDGFRYSARDIAVKRGQLERCPVVLGSATPSLESIHNVELQRYLHHRLHQRAAGAQAPTLRALDVRKQVLNAGFSNPLIQAIEETLSQGKQTLLFLNRRGYAPTLLCHDCGWMAQCHNCDARLTVHRRSRQLKCHHCAHSTTLPRHCPECRSAALLTAGLGTEQAEDFLRNKFSQFKLYRVDSDSMRNKEAMSELVSNVQTGEPCILLGTQMLTKGHHFPGVTLVGVIDADSALFSSDFRGEERMAQLLTQVGGRAGREGDSGQVILQTHYPDHPIIRAVLEQPYATHARAILDNRLSADLPPASYIALIRADASDSEGGEQFLLQLRQQVQAQLPKGAVLVGPLPSPMQRRAGKFRSQLLLRANTRSEAQAAAAILVEATDNIPKKALNWSIDIDPQDTF
ncbi:MAG: primosomal protein N' [Halioglobus sp.]